MGRQDVAACPGRAFGLDLQAVSPLPCRWRMEAFEWATLKEFFSAQIVGWSGTLYTSIMNGIFLRNLGVVMKTLISFSLAVLLSSTAYAGTLDQPPADTRPAVPVVAGTDWAGFYGGAFYGRSSGEMFDFGGPYVLNNDASMYGLFAGYRHDMGNWVLGAELASTVGMDVKQAAFPTWKFERLTDIKATVGYDMGRALVYASAGYSTSRFNWPVANSATYDGWNAGVGLDYLITDRTFLGVEYVYRSLERKGVPTWTGEFGTFQVRAGFNF